MSVHSYKEMTHIHNSVCDLIEEIMYPKVEKKSKIDESLSDEFLDVSKNERQDTMEERYSRVYLLKPNQYQLGSPVIIYCGRCFIKRPL